MTPTERETTYIGVRTAVRRSGLAYSVVQECVARSLVREPLTHADLVELRRIRRLQELGVNLQGIEIVLHMRRRIQALQAELSQWQRTQNRPDQGEPYEQRQPWHSSEMDEE